MQLKYKESARYGLTDKQKDKLKAQIEAIKVEYPQLLSEVVTK